MLYLILSWENQCQMPNFREVWVRGEREVLHPITFL